MGVVGCKEINPEEVTTQYRDGRAEIFPLEAHTKADAVDKLTPRTRTGKVTMAHNREGETLNNLQITMIWMPS